jgi:hypothetical protein
MSSQGSQTWLSSPISSQGSQSWLRSPIPQRGDLIEPDIMHVIQTVQNVWIGIKAYTNLTKNKKKDVLLIWTLSYCHDVSSEGSQV